jgi:predicted lipid-binding transport protein (Tim44 family)
MTFIFAVLSFVIIYKLFRSFGQIRKIDANQIKGRFSPKAVNTETVSNEVLQIQSIFQEYQNKSLIIELNIIFDTIFKAFASSRHEELKKMLSENMYESFSGQIAKREEKNLRQEIDIKHTETVISNVNVSDKKVTTTVLFTVSQMSITINSDDISHDNPGKLYIDVKHEWILERNRIDNSTWILTKTTASA